MRPPLFEGPPGCEGYEMTASSYLMYSLILYPCIHILLFLYAVCCILYPGFSIRLPGCRRRAHGQTFKPRLTGFPQPGSFQGTPRKSMIFRPTPQTLKTQKKVSPRYPTNY